MQDEQVLIARARKFDEAALVEIYDSLSPGIYRYAMRLLGDSFLAEDCVSETFTRFLSALERGGGPQEFLKAYLYRVAHNWITDYYRRNRPELETPLLLNSADTGPGPGEIVAEKMERLRARRALTSLTPDQRLVIVLKYLEGWKNDEVAQALGKTTGSVKALQHRALASLQRLMTREEELR